MKILHSSEPLYPRAGGVYSAVLDLCRETEKQGVSNHVLMPASLDAADAIKNWLPVTAESSGEILCRPLGWSPAFASKLLTTPGDILHTHGIWQHPSWVALSWKKRGKPHIASVHGMLEPWAWQHKAWKKRPVWWLWEKRNLQSASLLHATSEQEAQAFRDRGLTAPIAIIPNGVEIPAPIPDLRSPISGPKTALFLSRIHPKKGLPLLLEAWAKVRPAGWRLQIVGPDEGGHRMELERQAGLLGLSEVVEFSGPLTGAAKEEAFRDSSLFILPTHSENFGIAVAEAMARRLPVITTHGAPWQLLEQEACGWWVPVSVDGLASALDDATRRSPEELAAMGARGRKIVAERFAWDRIAAEMVACYEWLLGSGGKPECVMD